MIRIIIFILYFIFGIIASPFIGLFVFFMTLPDVWKGLKKKPDPNPWDVKIEESDILPDRGIEKKVDAENEMSIFYPHKGGITGN